MCSLIRVTLACPVAVSPVCEIFGTLGSWSQGEQLVYDPYLSTGLVSCTRGHLKVTFCPKP